MAEREDVDSIEICNAGDYNSEFEYDSEVDRRRKRRTDLAVKSKTKKSKLPQKTEVTTEYNKEESRKDLYHLLSLDAYSRHKKYINDYLLYYGGSSSEFRRDTCRDKTDFDVIRENHKFLWDEEEDTEETWGKRLAKKYYEKLFKEYCIADLSRYKENKIALRWRIESEVVAGKGQFVCGAKRCEEKEDLRSWEVNFAYVEHGQKRNALVKLRLCPECSHRLNYHHRKREIRIKKKMARRSDNSTISSHLETEELSEGQQESICERKADDTSVSAEGSGSDVNLWTKPVNVAEDKSRDDEFDEYFEDMFL